MTCVPQVTRSDQAVVSARRSEVWRNRSTGNEQSKNDHDLIQGEERSSKMSRSRFSRIQRHDSAESAHAESSDESSDHQLNDRAIGGGLFEFPSIDRLIGLGGWKRDT